jgi:hypothetical protein
MSRRKRSRIVPGEHGDPCPRCGQPTQVRTQAKLTTKVLAQPLLFFPLVLLQEPKMQNDHDHAGPLQGISQARQE